MMRRRPLARAAVVGGVAYHAGKKGAQNSAAERRRTSRSRISRHSRRSRSTRRRRRSTAATARRRPGAAGSDDMVAQLENLKKLLDEGILTQAEFDMQKQKLLAGA